MVSYDSPDTCSSVSYVGFNRNAHKIECRLKVAAAIAFSAGRVHSAACALATPLRLHGALPMKYSSYTYVGKCVITVIFWINPKLYTSDKPTY